MGDITDYGASVTISYGTSGEVMITPQSFGDLLRQEYPEEYSSVWFDEAASSIRETAGNEFEL